MSKVERVLAALGRSGFRSRIRLGEKELKYLRKKGAEEVIAHAAKFIEERLAPAFPRRDGQQTPRGNHPVFVAQHATATCCRGCLEKWHRIPQGRALTEAEKRYILAVISEWLSRCGGTGQPDDRGCSGVPTPAAPYSAARADRRDAITPGRGE